MKNKKTSNNKGHWLGIQHLALKHWTVKRGPFGMTMLNNQKRKRPFSLTPIEHQTLNDKEGPFGMTKLNNKKEVTIRPDCPTTTGHQHWTNKEMAIRPDYPTPILVKNKSLFTKLLFSTLGSSLFSTQNAQNCPRSPWPINTKTLTCKGDD